MVVVAPVAKNEKNKTFHVILLQDYPFNLKVSRIKFEYKILS
jgi:hypothetical protein